MPTSPHPVNSEPIDTFSLTCLYFDMPYHKICIFRTGALGDVILTLPVIHNLRNACPKAHIHLIGNPSLLSLAKADHIHIHDINRSIWAPLFAPKGKLPSDLQDLFQNTDLAISYLPDPDHIFTQNLQRLGVSKMITCPPKSNAQIHAIDHLLTPLRELNIPTPELQPRISLTEEEFQNASTHPTNSRTLLIHPGSGGKNKCWPPKHFASLADRLIRETNCSVTISSGPADEGLAQHLNTLMAKKTTLLPQLSIRHFAAFMTNCAAFLGNDSGPSHLAASLEIPTIALFGPTDSHTWGPRGPSVQIIQSPNQNMNGLSTERVYSQLHAHLSR
ncbi:MAG: glycosyltransferase family 9 protein [Candidatus Latescibacteria bacterium]|jgi:heptosyltransferase III|nr:glycosyltransferase family 9 protein [Candidatus Latescibacterota bacterium]